MNEIGWIYDVIIDHLQRSTTATIGFTFITIITFGGGLQSLTDWLSSFKSFSISNIDVDL